jgi:hypothetical protein
MVCLCVQGVRACVREEEYALLYRPAKDGRGTHVFDFVIRAYLLLTSNLLRFASACLLRGPPERLCPQHFRAFRRGARVLIALAEQLGWLRFGAKRDDVK